MANEEHLKILKQGVRAWNDWRRENTAVSPELRGANLHGADLVEANFIGGDFRKSDLSWASLRGVILRNADLFQANLDEADLSWVNLRDACLREAELEHTDLSHAVLRDADLQDANLSRAMLTGADLRGANFSWAKVDDTTFANVDLSAVRGLEHVIHGGPSIIGIETIYLSRGKIAPEFLRGAGVPDNFIEYMSSLVGTAFEFYSCFISYSAKDQEFADRLFADLQREGVRCWFAPHHVQSGKKLHEQIDVAIRLHERLLLILSPDSINSEWVKTEIAKARKREIQEGTRVLFPVRLNISYEQLQAWECFDADRGKDSAREIREYYIPDFTKWKDHDQYQEEFKKLVRDLKK
ncbi:MAG: hypothetical protein JWM83_147 [Candidatus Angelobacter sp.]|nr:hypothetical protein [Candidatus Angelobacter sp.]